MNTVVIGHKWIPVEEKMPKSGDKVLFLHNNMVRYGYYGDVKGWWKYNIINGFVSVLDRHVTHWMPLP